LTRLAGLDYLRGLSALGIMLFHYRLWYTGVESSESVFTRIGIYGVCVFYVLSGLTLYLVYAKVDKLNLSNLKLFYLKRILRIFPLLWLATFLKLLIDGNIPDATVLLTNLSGAIAFYRWDQTIAFGTWSIGHELAFYVFFPFLLYFLRKSSITFYFITALIFSIYVVFAFRILSTQQPFIDQWKTYTNPLNHAFLFISGMWVGRIFESISISKKMAWLVLLASVLIFVFFPVSGERIHLVVGFNRLIFTLTAIMICIAFYKIDFSLPKPIDRSLIILGHSSYSVYLLHPLMYRVTKKLAELCATYFFVIPNVVLLTTSALITIPISYLVYRYFESYFIRKDWQFKVYSRLGLLEHDIQGTSTDSTNSPSGNKPREDT
jgi:exopolysaccharide production protein ExoZ